MQCTTGRACRVLVLLVAVWGTPAPAFGETLAEDTPAVPADAGRAHGWLDGWSFTVAPYLWLPGVDGRTETEGVTTRVDVGIDDVLDLVGDGFSLLAAFGRIEAQRGRFLGFVDTSLMRLDTDESAAIAGITMGPLSTTPIRIDAKLRQDSVFVEFGLGYRVLEYAFLDRSRPFSADVLVGGRYYYYWTQVKATATATLLGAPAGPQILRAAGRTTTTVDWVDPIVGVRWSVPVLESLDVGFRGDVGGFEAGSDLAWSLTGTLRYHLPWRLLGIDQDVVLGYRVLDFDYESGSTAIDLSMSGPALGVMMHF